MIGVCFVVVILEVTRITGNLCLSILIFPLKRVCWLLAGWRVTKKAVNKNKLKRITLKSSFPIILRLILPQQGLL